MSVAIHWLPLSVPGICLNTFPSCKSVISTSSSAEMEKLASRGAGEASSAPGRAAPSSPEPGETSPRDIDVTRTVREESKTAVITSRPLPLGNRGSSLQATIISENASAEPSTADLSFIS